MGLIKGDGIPTPAPLPRSPINPWAGLWTADPDPRLIKTPPFARADPDPAFIAALTGSCNAWSNLIRRRSSMAESPSPSSLTLGGASLLGCARFTGGADAPLALDFRGTLRATPPFSRRRTKSVAACLRRRALAARNPFATPAAHILQIYKRTDGSYMGSPEMSPLYGVVNALAQTAAAIILFLASTRSCSLPSASLPSPDQSLLLLFLRIRSHFCLTVTAVRHFRTPTRSSDSLPFV